MSYGTVLALFCIGCCVIAIILLLPEMGIGSKKRREEAKRKLDEIDVNQIQDGDDYKRILLEKIGDLPLDDVDSEIARKIVHIHSALVGQGKIKP